MESNKWVSRCQEKKQKRKEKGKKGRRGLHGWAAIGPRLAGRGRALGG
jgi:hypothetical protein